MSSNAQIEANQRNAAHSTGPRTPDGKAIVSQNATSHGLTGAHIILPGEDAAGFDNLLLTLRSEHSPNTTAEDFLVQQMAQAHWKLLRTAVIEQQILFAAMGDESIVDRPAARLANLFLDGGSPAKALDRLARYEAAARRVWFQSLKQLTELQRSANAQPADLRNKPNRPHAFTAVTGPFATPSGLLDELRLTLTPPIDHTSLGSPDSLVPAHP